MFLRDIDHVALAHDIFKFPGPQGDVLLPAIVEGEELLLLLARTSERYFDVVRHSSNASHHGIDVASGSRLLR